MLCHGFRACGYLTLNSPVTQRKLDQHMNKQMFLCSKVISKGGYAAKKIF